MGGSGLAHSRAKQGQYGLHVEYVAGVDERLWNICW